MRPRPAGAPSPEEAPAVPGAPEDPAQVAPEAPEVPAQEPPKVQHSFFL